MRTCYLHRGINRQHDCHVDFHQTRSHLYYRQFPLVYFSHHRYCGFVHQSRQNLDRICVWVRCTWSVGCRLQNASVLNLHVHGLFWFGFGVPCQREIYKFTKWCATKNACVKLVVIFVCICFINAHMLWTYGIDHDTKCTVVKEQLRYYDKKIFIWIDLCVLSLIPFSIMFVCSLLIINKLKDTGTVRHSVNHNSTHLLVILATVYICLSLPNSVTYPVDAFRSRCRYCDAQWKLAWTVTYLLQLCNYAINTMIYTLQSKTFNEEMRKLISCHIFRFVLHLNK